MAPKWSVPPNNNSISQHLPHIYPLPQLSTSLRPLDCPPRPLATIPHWYASSVISSTLSSTAHCRTAALITRPCSRRGETIITSWQPRRNTIWSLVATVQRLGLLVEISILDVFICLHYNTHASGACEREGHVVSRWITHCPCRLKILLVSHTITGDI